jgi:hypothetical protein
MEVFELCAEGLSDIYQNDDLLIDHHTDYLQLSVEEQVTNLINYHDYQLNRLIDEAKWGWT